MKKIIFSLVLTSTIALVKAQSNNKAGSSLLTDWMDLQCQLVRKTKGIQHVAYSRHFAYTAIAAYESLVSGHRNYRSLAGQLNALQVLPTPPKGKISWEASLNAAYATMLRQFYSSFGNSSAIIDSMEKLQFEKLINTGVNDVLIKNGSRYGTLVATKILEWAGQDDWNLSKEYKPLSGEGIWTPSPSAAAPFWFEKRPLTTNLFSVYALVPPKYSADSTAGFYTMAKEVYSVSQPHTAEQKAIALFWDDSPNGKYMTVFGHWTSILSGILKDHQFPLMKAAEAFARMAISMHEASILVWKGKYQYNVVRPITFIQQHIDKQWTPLIATPPHPEFPAAHATLSNSAATALCVSFGNNCKVTDVSYLDIGMKEKTFSSLQEAAKEAGFSRLYGGIHYRYSIEQGLTLGAAAADHLNKTIHFRQ